MWGEPREGWHYADTLNFGGFVQSIWMYQKTQGNVFVYVKPQIGFYHAQMYERGGRQALCLLEARSDDPEPLFELAESWLERYSQHLDKIGKDDYFIANPEGVWGSGPHEKVGYMR